MIFDAITSAVFSLLIGFVELLPDGTLDSSSVFAPVADAFNWLGGIYAGFVYSLNGIGGSHQIYPIGTFMALATVFLVFFYSAYFAWRVIKWVIELIRG